MIERWLGRLVLVFLLGIATSAAFAQQTRDGGVLRVGIQPTWRSQPASRPDCLIPFLPSMEASSCRAQPTGHT